MLHPSLGLKSQKKSRSDTIDIVQSPRGNVLQPFHFISPRLTFALFGKSPFQCRLPLHISPKALKWGNLFGHLLENASRKLAFLSTQASTRPAKHAKCACALRMRQVTSSLEHGASSFETAVVSRIVFT